MALLDLKNKRFGRLTAIKIDHIYYKTPRKLGSVVYWKCKCDCGKECVVRTVHLTKGYTKSCGCLQKERTSETNTRHSLSNTRIYYVWGRIIGRCTNEKSNDYKYYGGRGIKICNEWKNNFQSFYDWARNNGYKEGLTIDRIDVNGDYEPSNCRWVSRKIQSLNKRDNHFITYKGKTQTLTEWGQELNIKPSIISERINKLSWTIEDSLLKPIRKIKKGNKNERRNNIINR